MGRRKTKPRQQMAMLGERSTIDHDSEEEPVASSLNGNHELRDGNVPSPPRAYNYVHVDRSNWNASEHRDISEIVLSNLRFASGLEEDYLDSGYGLRFRVWSGDNGYAKRIKPGHWPIFSAADVILEVVTAAEVHGGVAEKKHDNAAVVVSGNFEDGTDEGVSGIVHLVSLKFLTLRPLFEGRLSRDFGSLRLRVEVLQRAFDASGGGGLGSLLDVGRQVWKKSMMNVMGWLRPEVTNSEARYGVEVLSEADVGIEVDDHVQKCLSFDVARFYEAIQPSKDCPMLEAELPDLLPELRPYQRRAAYWMVQRERETTLDKHNRILSPFCVSVTLVDSSTKMFYNPFSGNISLSSEDHPSCVFGGILADEMGMGKTVELLACVFANQKLASESGLCSDSITEDAVSQKLGMRRVKRERVECICGAVSESFKYGGLWVQCDVCDAWQHAECVGFSPNRKRKKFEEAPSQDEHDRKTRKKSNTKIILMDGDFICQLCYELIQATGSPVASAATLIVCPSSILPQWHSEIICHTRPGSLRTCIYEGVRHNSLTSSPINISELLDADIVLTTYDILKEDLSHDFDRHVGDRRLMRHEKRYPVTPTLLTRIYWWRICLDEAQMVESTAAAATEMAMRLHARNRWCITGTPIQHKLDDLYTLLRFLKVVPYDLSRWWVEVIRNPYERKDAGAIEFTHSLFKQLMWRSSKLLVADELQLPPQEECISWLSLSPIEEHFYQRQHETCLDHAVDVLKTLKAGILKTEGSGAVSCDLQSDSLVTHADAAKLLNSLLKLRQACCHPQVGSYGLRTLQQSPMTMDEILSVLVNKTKIEGEEALRKVVSSLNGLAGIEMIRGEASQAISLYKEALSIAEDHSEDFRLDPLLNLHIHHNLSEILILATNKSQVQLCGGHLTRTFIEGKCVQHISKKRKILVEGDSNADIESGDPCGKACHPKGDVQFSSSSNDCLLEVCENIKQKYLSAYYSKLSMAQEEFQKSYKQVMLAYNDNYHHKAWWLEPLLQIEQNNDAMRDLLGKIDTTVLGSHNSEKASRIISRFHSINSLKYYIETGLDSLEACRRKLIDQLMEIDQTMKHPREGDIEHVRHCPICNMNEDGPLCVHCQLDELFQAYEARLFLLKRSGGVVASAEEAVDLRKKKLELNHFYWPSAQTGKASASSSSKASEETKRTRDTGKMLVVSRSPSELEVALGVIRSYFKPQLGRDSLSAANKHLNLLEGMRKEYTHARSLSTAQAQVLCAHDEIKMATSRLRLRENDEDIGLDALSLEELDIADVQNSSEKFVSIALLDRTKGKLRYLQSLVRSHQRKDSEEGPTGILNSCIEEKKNEIKADDELCPVCQEKLQNQRMVFPCGHVTCCKCLFAITERRVVLNPKQHNNLVMCPTCRQESEFSNIALADDRPNRSQISISEGLEEAVHVNGSYGTKIEAITRRILWIKSADPMAKVLVFSCWNDVLDLLEHAFRTNQIRYVRMKGGRKSQTAISIFKSNGRSPQKVGKTSNHEQELMPVQVLLLLIQHGANGLNLLEAQHVILAEPQLNPAAEAQAIGRVHRIGQKNKTVVQRFLVKGTVEESIHKLNKSRNSNSFISGNKKKHDQPLLTLKDVESLFSAASSAVPQNHDNTGDLMHLPPSVAAAVAAEGRLNHIDI